MQIQLVKVVRWIQLFFNIIPSLKYIHCASLERMNEWMNKLILTVTCFDAEKILIFEKFYWMNDSVTHS